MTISTIVAAARNNVIAHEGELPWHLPDDLRFFKEKTLNHHVIMGRKTFETFGKPLPKRTNIVVTRNPHYIANEAIVVHSVKEGLEIALKNGEEEAFIIGGGKIYQQTKDIWDVVYLTRVDMEPEGDVFFPKLEPDKWMLEWQEFHPPDERHEVGFTFKKFRRKR